MNGGFLHDSVILGTLERGARRRGATCERQYAVPGERPIGFIDLLVAYRGYRIAYEAELTSRRVLNDVDKAITTGVDMLVIVVPTSAVAVSARARLRSQRRRWVEAGIKVLVATLPQAIQQLERIFGLLDAVNVPGVQKSKSPGSSAEDL